MFNIDFFSLEKLGHENPIYLVCINSEHKASYNFGIILGREMQKTTWEVKDLTMSSSQIF